MRVVPRELALVPVVDVIASFFIGPCNGVAMNLVLGDDVRRGVYGQAGANEMFAMVHAPSPRTLLVLVDVLRVIKGEDRRPS